MCEFSSVCLRVCVCVWPPPLIHFTFHFLSRLSNDPRHLGGIQFLSSSTLSSFSLLLSLITPNWFSPHQSIHLSQPHALHFICGFHYVTFGQNLIRLRPTEVDLLVSPLGYVAFANERLQAENCSDINVKALLRLVKTFFLHVPHQEGGQRPGSDQEQHLNSWCDSV